MSTATIERDQRNWAAMAHLSGLAYLTVLPFAGLIAPIAVMIAKQEEPVVSALARQALYLNIASIACGVVAFLLMFTLVLIPVSIALWTLVAIAQLGLPIYGAIVALDGRYFRYPVIGHDPPAR
jgi:uncharacterized Tic20 family protein